LRQVQPDPHTARKSAEGLLERFRGKAEPVQDGPGPRPCLVPADVAEACMQIGQRQVIAPRLGIRDAALHGSEFPVPVDYVLDGGPIRDLDLLGHVGGHPSGRAADVPFIRLQAAEDHVEQG
jgi:hypothetical protein